MPCNKKEHEPEKSPGSSSRGDVTARCHSCPGRASDRFVADTPDFRVVVRGHFDVEALADFNQRVRNYVELRRIAERGIPPLKITENPDEIINSERTLTRRIREVRGSSDRGQIFSRQMEKELQELFVIAVDSATLSAIMDDGPDELDVDVNEAYARDKSLTTMPPNILLLLPALGEDMEYRFVGRHLIVRDVRANMIVDEIPYALSANSVFSRLRSMMTTKPIRATGRKDQNSEIAGYQDAPRSPGN